MGQNTSVMIQTFVTTRGSLQSELLDLNHTSRITLNPAVGQIWRLTFRMNSTVECIRLAP
jgi:hypothetical protein